MADPLSIAASIAGLLAVAGQISGILYELVSSAAHASQSVRQAFASVEEMKLVLESVKQLLDNGLSKVSDQRKRMINVSNLLVVFRQSIISLSEMEALVVPAIGPDGRLQKWNLLKWTIEKDDFAQCLRRVESHKASLTAILSILHCQSDLEASQNLRSLQNAVQLVLQQNQDILHRIEQYNIHLGVGGASVRFLDDDVSTIRAQRRSYLEPASSPRYQALPGSKDDPPTQSKFDKENMLHEFETTLYETRVYRRAQSDECDTSFTSSAVLTHAWSVLSDLSLSDVSVVSVIALPISLEDVTSIGQNLTFANLLASDGPEIPNVEASTHPGDLPPRSWDAKSGRTVIRKAHPPLAGLGLRQPIDLNTTAAIPVHKLVLLGDRGVGKTALAAQFCTNRFVETYDPTIEESYRRKAQIDGKPSMLEVLDTAGQDEYMPLRDQWIRGGEGFIVVYSVSSRSSFVRVLRLHEQILRLKQPHPQHPPPLMLVANKCERETEREVSPREGAVLARQLQSEFVEASAKSLVNVEKAFYDVVRQIRRASLQSWVDDSITVGELRELREQRSNVKEGVRRRILGT